MERERLIERQIAILIDVENVGLNSIQWLFDQISDIGRIIIKRAYAEWDIAGDKREKLLELGIEAIPLLRSSSSGKNASDIRLVIDAVDLLHTSIVDTYVIVSSDSDFVPLVGKLRAAGKTVLGAGEQDKAPRTLVKSCDRYFYLDQGDIARKGKKLSSWPVQDIENLIKRAATASIDEHGKVVGSKLHQTILRLDPSFDYRFYDHPTFTQFLEAQPSLKVVRPRGPGDVTIELIDLDSTLATEPSYSEDIWSQIDRAWLKRATKKGQSLPGPIAAIEAAKIIGVTKLSASQYKTLQGLLDASNYLSERWLRDRNTITRR